MQNDAGRRKDKGRKQDMWLLGRTEGACLGQIDDADGIEGAFLHADTAATGRELEAREKEKPQANKDDARKDSGISNRKWRNEHAERLRDDR